MKTDKFKAYQIVVTIDTPEKHKAVNELKQKAGVVTSGELLAKAMTALEIQLNDK